jgi:hypothetical protein
MMEVTKVLLYCTKAKPFMAIDEDGYHLVEHPTGDLNDYAGKVFNGLIGFECDCKEAIKVVYDKDPKISAYGVFSGRFKGLDSICDRSCLSIVELCRYGSGKDLYAYHFENVNPIEPMPITQLYKDEACTIPLTKAPQSYCFVYQKYYRFCKVDSKTMEISDYGNPIIRKVLVFSIRSPWLCKEANGDKDFEVRTGCVKNAGIEYK